MTLQKRERGACCLLLLMGYDWNSNSNALFVIILLMPEASKYLIKKQLHVVCQSRALNFWYTKLRIFDYDMLIESKTKLFAQALQYIIYALFCDSTYLQCTSLLKEAWQITKAIIAFLIISFLDFSRKGKEKVLHTMYILLTSIIPLLQSFAVISLSTELPYILKGMICLYSSTICSNMHLILISAVTLPQTMFLVLAGCTNIVHT